MKKKTKFRRYLSHSKMVLKFKIGSIVFRGLALIVGSASLFVCYSMLTGDAEFNANALAVGFMLGVPFLMYAIGGPKLLDYFGLSHFNK